MKKQTENTTQATPEDRTFADLQAENEQLKATIRLNAAQRQITGELKRAGARSPKLLFDAVKGDLQFADDGSLANTAAIVERLTKKFPEQFGSEPRHTSIDGGAGRITAPALTKDALAKMSPAEIARLDWAVVRQALTEK